MVHAEIPPPSPLLTHKFCRFADEGKAVTLLVSLFSRERVYGGDDTNQWIRKMLAKHAVTAMPQH